MFYYLYEIRNILNGKIYVGVHKTNDMEDGYMGSGKIIRAAIKKYGIENFTKVILETFENAEAMYAREKEVVNEEFLLREDVYNLCRGGTGGFEYINKIRSIESRRESGLMGAARGGKRFSKENNPNLGKIYITDGITDRRVCNGFDIPSGWYRGRTKGGWNSRKLKTMSDRQIDPLGSNGDVS